MMAEYDLQARATALYAIVHGMFEDPTKFSWNHGAGLQLVHEHLGSGVQAEFQAQGFFEPASYIILEPFGSDRAMYLDRQSSFGDTGYTVNYVGSEGNLHTLAISNDLPNVCMLVYISPSQGVIPEVEPHASLPSIITDMIATGESDIIAVSRILAQFSFLSKQMTPGTILPFEQRLEKYKKELGFC